MPIENDHRPALRSTIWLNRDGPVEKWLRNCSICWLDDIGQDTTALQKRAEVMLKEWLQFAHPDRVEEPQSFVHERVFLVWPPAS